MKSTDEWVRSKASDPLIMRLLVTLAWVVGRGADAGGSRIVLSGGVPAAKS